MSNRLKEAIGIGVMIFSFTFGIYAILTLFNICFGGSSIPLTSEILTVLSIYIIFSIIITVIDYNL